MRYAFLMLLVGTAAADPTPRQPRVTNGIAGKLRITRTSGVPNGHDYEGPRQCTFRIIAGSKTITAKTDAEGEFHVELAPGSYKLEFDDCTKACQKVLPEPPASIEIKRAEWKQINFTCMFYGK